MSKQMCQPTWLIVPIKISSIYMWATRVQSILKHVSYKTLWITQLHHLWLRNVKQVPPVRHFHTARRSFLFRDIAASSGHSDNWLHKRKRWNSTGTASDGFLGTPCISHCSSPGTELCKVLYIADDHLAFVRRCLIAMVTHRSSHSVLLVVCLMPVPLGTLGAGAHSQADSHAVCLALLSPADGKCLMLITHRWTECTDKCVHICVCLPLWLYSSLSPS